MIKAQIKKSGWLLITADNESRRNLKECYNPQIGGGYWAVEKEVAEELEQFGFPFVRPEWVGALTDSPIITDNLILSDNDVVEFVGDVWWFPGYMLTDPWKELKNKGRVLFEPEENNKSLPNKAV